MCLWLALLVWRLGRNGTCSPESRIDLAALAPEETQRDTWLVDQRVRDSTSTFLCRCSRTCWTNSGTSNDSGVPVLAIPPEPAKAWGKTAKDGQKAVASERLV